MAIITACEIPNASGKRRNRRKEKVRQAMLMLKATAKQSADKPNAMTRMDIKSVPDTSLLWHIVIDGFKNRV